MNTTDIQLIDIRKHPEVYKIGKGEQGVFLYEPYRTELIPHWKFKPAKDAQKSSKKLYSMFLNYLANNEFAGADMARKYLEMGLSRAKRYANLDDHQNSSSASLAKPEDDKLAAVVMFEEKYELAITNKRYLTLKEKHKKAYSQ